MTQSLLVTWLQVRPFSDLEHVCYGGGSKCLRGSMCMCLSLSSVEDAVYMRFQTHMQICLKCA